MRGTSRFGWIGRVGALATLATVATGLAVVLWLAGAATAMAAPAAGPPYPAPVTGQRVYDYAGILSPTEISKAEGVIRAIEERTGAQVAVYTQVKPGSDTTAAAEADARALMDQWGVGRKGFDDGLVILFDMESNLRHGQVNLYAGAGFRADFLSNAERQSIFENDMKPLLQTGEFDAALAAALDRIDAAATPEHAAQLERDRQLNAVLGFGVALLAVVLVAVALFWWFRHGRDPVYIDDESVLMPAPPAGLTPAMATLLMDDRTTQRTTVAAMIDLASRGWLSFRQEHHALKDRAGIASPGRPADPVGGPEQALGVAIRDELATRGGYIEPRAMTCLAGPVSEFSSKIQDVAVQQGWLTRKPSTVVAIWVGIGIAEIVAGIALLIWGGNNEASGGILGGIALSVAGVATVIIGYFMPARTAMGAMLNAWLQAYRRTLQKTMAMSQSMTEVVEKRPLPWVTTPDATMAWGIAFGLQSEIEAVLKRGLETSASTGAPVAWAPVWWAGGSSGGSGGFASNAGSYSSSAIPDFGSMMSALGTIGSSGSSSGGGGFGGGGGGGGGGAGGGF